MLSKRLKAIRKERGLTQADIAKQFDVTQQAIAKWEASMSFPDSATIAGLAKFFNVSSDYLLGITDSFYPAGSFSNVKIIGTVKAGYGALADEETLGTAPADVKNAEEYRYLVVNGDSMAPLIREGDLALIRIQPTLQNGDIGVVIYKDGEATLKKYYYKNGAVVLEPFNDEYKTLTIKGNDLNDFIIFGKVVETTTKW